MLISSLEPSPLALCSWADLLSLLCCPCVESLQALSHELCSSEGPGPSFSPSGEGERFRDRGLGLVRDERELDVELVLEERELDVELELVGEGVLRGRLLPHEIGSGSGP